MLFCVLAGCGDGQNTGSESALSKAESSSSASELASSNESGTDSSAEVSQTGTDNDEAVWPRTYTDAAGREVTLEAFPEKIVVDYLPYWEYMIALGITPAGAASADHYRDTWDAFKAYDTSATEDMGDELNLEKLLELEPDVIFIASEEGVENLEKIAPVIVMDGQLKQDWRFGLREFAGILGLEEKAEAYIAEVDGRLAEEKVRLGEVLEGKTVLMLSVMGKDRYFSARRTDFYDAETGLGFTAPEGFPDFGEGYQQLTLEAIADMNPDVVFLAVFNGDEAIAEELQGNSVWQSIQAVKDGSVYTIDGAAHSTSVISVEYTIDRMVDYLTADAD